MKRGKIRVSMRKVLGRGDKGGDNVSSGLECRQRRKRETKRNIGRGGRKYRE